MEEEVSGEAGMAGEDSGEVILILSAGSSPGFPGGGGQVPIFPNMPLL